MSYVVPLDGVPFVPLIPIIIDSQLIITQIFPKIGPHSRWGAEGRWSQGTGENRSKHKYEMQCAVPLDGVPFVRLKPIIFDSQLFLTQIYPKIGPHSRWGAEDRWSRGTGEN